MGPPIEIESMRFAVDVSEGEGKLVAFTDRGRVWHHKGGWSGSGPIFQWSLVRLPTGKSLSATSTIWLVPDSIQFNCTEAIFHQTLLP